MKELKDQKETKYVIVHNKVDVFELITVNVGQVMTSGQPYMEVFSEEKKAGSRLNELSGKKLYPFEKL